MIIKAPHRKRDFSNSTVSAAKHCKAHIRLFVAVFKADQQQGQGLT